MIRSLRRRHAKLILGIAAIVPIVVLLALAARPTPPIMASSAPRPAVGSWTALGPNDGLHALVESVGTQEWLHLARDEKLVAPDVLVYWSPEAPVDKEPFPSSAVLLGALGDTGAQTFDLPASDVSGVLLLYSLAHQSTIATTPMTRIRRLDHER